VSPATVRSRARARSAESTRPLRRTHAQRREEAQARLLEAALAIVARRGAVRMTLAEVAEAAGYSRGLPAHRFGSKAGLLHALAGHIGARFGQQREQGPALAPGLDSIVGNIDFYFSRSRGERRDAWTATRALLVMMTEAFMAPPSSALRKELIVYNRKALAWFERHIAIGIERGEIAPGTEPAVTAVVLLGAMRGAMLQWLVDGRIPLLAVRDRLLAIVEQVLRVPARTRASAKSR
jgi:AcrR family transcriptional regulator